MTYRSDRDSYGFDQALEDILPEFDEYEEKRIGLTGPASLPRVTGVPRFVNSGTSHMDNCCALCPVTLGVGIDGQARNGMELQFTISGHRPDIWYDVLRTRRNSLWERRTGVWTRLETQPMGTWDDCHSDDECLRPRHNRIFAIDGPGYGIILPAPAGTRFAGFTPGVATHADATDVVLRLSFAEWVNARSSAPGSRWTRISPARLRSGIASHGWREMPPTNGF